MVTKRLSVAQKSVNWVDGQKVSEAELDDEQSRNTNIDAATIANFFGSGIIESNAVSVTIFDSEALNTSQQALVDGYAFDGTNVYVGSSLQEVSDAVNGVNLSVELTDVRLDGIEAYSKVCIIGDDFNGDLIHDDFIFNTNCKKITNGRYSSIRAILFNNFAGNSNGSLKLAAEVDGYDLIGRCLVKEANSFEVSVDCVVAEQVQQPNQFFSSFIPSNSSYTVTQMLQEAIGADKSTDDLNIALTSIGEREIAINDVTTKIAQKFKATGTNIQKISILLSVEEDPLAIPGEEYAWAGNLNLEIYKLQTDVSCPVSPIPDTAVDFDPDPSILAYVSLTKDDLERQGVILNGTPQVIDFIFTGSQVSNPLSSVIQKDNYYVFAFGRSGDTHTGTLVIQEATDRYEYGYMTIFDGVQWINVKDSDMWFSVMGDYVKISDGLSFVDGVGVEIPKLKENASNVEVAYTYGKVPLYSVARNYNNYALLEKDTEYSEPVQDERTGNLVYSRYVPAPQISMINSSQLTTLRISEPAPVLLAKVYDSNPRQNVSSITGTTELIGLAYNNEFNIIRPNIDVRTQGLVNSILIPNSSRSYEYRIISAELVQDAYGDINGDGVIDIADWYTINSWMPDGYDLSTTRTQNLISGGYISVEEILRADVNGDGVVDSTDAYLVEQYVNKTIQSFPAGSTFPRMCLTVENLTDPLNVVVEIQTIDSEFSTVPFTELDWEIEYFASWCEELIEIEDLRRLMPTTFTEEATDDDLRGKNSFFIPGDLVIEGDIINADGTSFKLDLEITQVTMDIPILDDLGQKIFLDGYVGIDLFETFVAESSEGKTAYGFDAMKYGDESFVQMADFAAGKVKVVPKLQSVSSQYQVVLGSSIKDIIGLYYDPLTSMMTIYVDNVYDDEGGNLLPPVSTKVLIDVYLKKSGFTNESSFINKSQMLSLFGL
jgi:hypothetical protein